MYIIYYNYGYNNMSVYKQFKLQTVCKLFMCVLFKFSVKQNYIYPFHGWWETYYNLQFLV